MQVHLRTSSMRWLAAAGLAAGLCTAALAVTPQQETQVKVGMSTQEIVQALGQPAEVVSYRQEPGPTWTYDVSRSGRYSVLEIEFDAAGRVASFDERELSVE